MPKDDWLKARNKQKSKKNAKRTGPRGMSKEAKEACTERLSKPETKLWFGKHKGMMVKDVPREYLRWLANQDNHRNWRMKTLVAYIRGYLCYH